MRLIFGVLLFLVTFAAAEEDAAYECFQNFLQKMNNSSCPLIVGPEKNYLNDRKNHSRLFTSCAKGHYLIHGCNETEWARVCTKQVANLPSSWYSYKLQNPNLRWEYCNEGVNDQDYECLNNALRLTNNESCPEVREAMKQDLDYKKLVSMTTSCIKKHYLNYGCIENAWNNVCNKRFDSFNVDANGGQENIDIAKMTCTEEIEDSAYDCFVKATKQMMNSNSCPEVSHASNQNATKDEIFRQQMLCYKRYFLNSNCDVAEWQRVCNKSIKKLPVEMNGQETIDLALKYCNV